MTDPTDGRTDGRTFLLTGATGLVGSAVLRRLLDRDLNVRCLVRDPRRLGPDRVRVQITLGDLADPVAIRQAVRGVDAVLHLAAAIRDQPAATIEELNGLATIRLLRDAERAGVERFVFFSALGATESSATRFFRSKALAEAAVLATELESAVFAPSIVYAPGDPWMQLLSRLSLLPWMPVAGTGRAEFQPIWAEDAADCVLAVLLDDEQQREEEQRRTAQGKRPRRLELAGPEVVTYEAMVRLALELDGRRRPLVHVPLRFVRRGLRVVERLWGPAAFATWEEAQLMEEPMTTSRGALDVRALGVDPKPMREVLGLAG